MLSRIMAELRRDEVDALPGFTVLEFGASWCGICQGARAMIDATLSTRTDLRHLWIEDGPGRPLGRSYRVKLWPTLIFLVDGREVARVVRPRAAGELRDALAQLA
jgi:thioredoxin 1